MQQKLCAVVGMVFCLIFFSCQTSLDESRQEVKEFQGNVGDFCFDIQLEVWLTKFNQYQQQGTEMFEADARAREAALQAFLNCQSKTDVLANEAARKE